IKDNEARPIVKVIKEVAYKHNITQVIIGETPQNRWEEITKGSFINILLKELVFIDVHIVSVNRALESGDAAIMKRELEVIYKSQKIVMCLTLQNLNTIILKVFFIKK